MKLWGVLVALAATAQVASGSWVKEAQDAAYNRWHETELERWLSDNGIPYPSPADRKTLQDVMQKNWQAYAVAPYQAWDVNQLQSYLKLKGINTKSTAKTDKDSLLAQVRTAWYETEDSAQQAWAGVSNWILDTWSDSQLKAFADKHGIPVPQPRKRDTILQRARENYEKIAQKAGEAYNYPGNWLYATWSNSELKEWLEARGFPVPQPAERDTLIAAVRRNSRLAYLMMQDQLAIAAANARATYNALTDRVIDSWGQSQLKEFCDKNDIPVPQGSNENEVRALIRKRRASILDGASSASSAVKAATTSAGNQYAKATDSASLKAQEAFNEAINTWNAARLKAYLEARSVHVPYLADLSRLRGLVREHSDKAASNMTVWTFDDFSYESLKAYLSSLGDGAGRRASDHADASREDLVQSARSAYLSASKTGGDQYASMTSNIAVASEAARKSAFSTWSESELKAYLDRYGVPVPQASTVDELRAAARKHSTYFRYGTKTPSETFLAKMGENVQGTWQWVMDRVHMGGDGGKAKSDGKDEL